MTAQTGPQLGAGFSTASRSASMSLRSTEAKPAGSGWKLLWKTSWPVAASVASVRPWKLLWALTMPAAPSSLTSPQRRATLMAPSLASAPELPKNVRQVVPVEPSTWPDSSVTVESRSEMARAASLRFSM